MKDKNGLYYYPYPSDRKTRVYVRKGPGDVEFRLWREEHPEVWERHPWLCYSVVQSAAEMYKESGTGSDPLILYDRNVADALLKEEDRAVAKRG